MATREPEYRTRRYGAASTEAETPRPRRSAADRPAPGSERAARERPTRERPERVERLVRSERERAARAAASDRPERTAVADGPSGVEVPEITAERLTAAPRRRDPALWAEDETVRREPVASADTRRPPRRADAPRTPRRADTPATPPRAYRSEPARSVAPPPRREPPARREPPRRTPPSVLPPGGPVRFDPQRERPKDRGRGALILLPIVALIAVIAGGIGAIAITDVPKTKSLQRQVSTLKTELNTANTELGALKTSLAQRPTSTAISRLTKSVNGLKHSVGGLQQGEIPLKAKLNALAACVPELQGELNGTTVQGHGKKTALVRSAGLSAACSSVLGG